MTTVLKSRRSGEDLRNHPTVRAYSANADTLDIQIVKLGPTPRDRGRKRIVVNGLNWGWYDIEHHGCHGPSYHAHDAHGAIMVPESRDNRRHDLTSDAFRPRGQRYQRTHNIGLTEDQQRPMVSTDDQLREHARQLIKNGYLKHPDVRAAEVAEHRRQSEESTRRFEAQQKAEWDDRIDSVLDVGHPIANKPGHIEFTTEQLREEIRTAMKWAQSR